METDLIDVGFTDDVKKGGPGRGGGGGFTAPVGGPDGIVPMPMPMHAKDQPLAPDCFLCSNITSHRHMYMDSLEFLGPC